jgi:hypothetical protein
MVYAQDTHTDPGWHRVALAFREMKPEELDRIASAVQRAYARYVKDYEIMSRALQDAVRVDQKRYGELYRLTEEAAKQAVTAYEPLRASLPALEKSLGTTFVPPPPPPPPPDFNETHRVLKALEVTNDGRPERAQLDVIIAKHSAEMIERLVVSSRDNTVALGEAIGHLVESSDNNTETMSALTRQYVRLTWVIAVAAVVGLVVALLGQVAAVRTKPPQVEVHVPAPVVNVQAVVAPPPTTMSAPTPRPGR